MSESIKKLKKQPAFWLLAAGLAAGIVLIVSGSLGIFDKTSEVPQNRSSYTDEDVKKYVRELEDELKTLISGMDGVSNVSVMIFPDQSRETVYAKDEKSGGSGTSESEYVIVDGGRTVELKTVYPKIRGVAVVCGGGSNPIVKERIIYLVCALFSLDSNSVYVTG